MPSKGGAFLSRLAQDTCGNTLAMMAAAVFPLIGLIGGGVDISRMYLVKSRLQQACDAGSLAGRKAMGGGNWTTGSNSSEARALSMFGANFKQNDYGTGTLLKNFTENDGVVTGAASVVVPMTLMRVFGFAQWTLNVNCTAKMEIPNTDIMFVLDVTGSMNCAPEDANINCNQGVATSSKRITGLKRAVKCFYETVARLDITDTDCGSTPSGGAGTAQIRFGFVPYSTNVNVGKLLPNDYMVDSWFYQTRKANLAVPPQKTETYWEQYPNSISQSNCLKYMSNQAFSGFTPTPTNSGGPIPQPTVVSSFPSDGSASSESGTGEWGWAGSGRSGAGGAPDQNGSDRTCRRRRTDTTTYYQEKFQNWTYGQLAVDVSGLKAGENSWNGSISLPIGDTTEGNDVPDVTVNWDGCIEERQTVEVDDFDFDPIPTDAFDLNIDMLPTSDASRWKPALRDVIFTRRGTSTGNWNPDPITTTSDYNNGSYYACPVQARKLETWGTSLSFQTYVNSLSPSGNTYHDIGILWGARLMSPTGIFGSENAFTPNGGAIDRHMIFMTDGDTNANNSDYAAYGVPWFDRRQTTFRPNGSDMNNQVNARFAALCSEIKNKNITLWVISFGAGVNTDTQTRLSTCASPGKFFSAADTNALINQFKQIANEIADLRLTT